MIDINDAKEVFFLRSDPKVNQYVDRPRAKNLEDAESHIQKILTGIANKEMIHWGIYPEGSDRHIGSLGYWQFNEEKTSCDIGYELHPEYWGKGIMQEAFLATLPVIFDVWNFEGIEAWVQVDNQGSIRFLEKNNFSNTRRVPAKESGDSDDMFVYCLRKKDRNG
ncbi:MAG: GNAT family N-acetyltransferase [Saprospiraceae bacterium]|nr:GNAT family N-acetyltransferase [Saprospiraceae bacterium]